MGKNVLFFARFCETIATGVIDLFVNWTAPSLAFAQFGATTLGLENLYILSVNSSTSSPFRLRTATPQPYPPQFAVQVDITFQNFSTDISAFNEHFQITADDLLRTRPDVACIESPYRCQNSTVPSGADTAVIDVYRTANNDSFIFTLDNENAGIFFSSVSCFCFLFATYFFKKNKTKQKKNKQPLLVFNIFIVLKDNIR